jgi:MFS family permease
VLALRFSDRIGKGMRTAPRDAWIAGMIPSESRGRAYGFHRSMDNAGAIMGPLLASAFLFFFPGELRKLFLWSVIPGLVGVFCIAAAKWSMRTRPPETPDERSAEGRDNRLILTIDFKRYLGILFIFTMAGSSDAFLLLKLSQAGVAASALPLLWAALHVIKSGSSILGGRMADSLGRRVSIIMGWTWYAVIYTILGLTDSTPVVITTFLAYGLYYGFTESAERALVADMLPPHARGRAFGLFNLIEGLGALPASLLFGLLWKTLGAPTAFMVAAGLSLIAAILMALWRFQYDGRHGKKTASAS